MSEPKSDEERRLERAARIRRQADRLIEAGDDARDDTSGADFGAEPAAGESPRDAINRRMRELGDDPI